MTTRMVSTTDRLKCGYHVRRMVALVLACIAVGGVVISTGCTKTNGTSTEQPATTDARKGYGMGGVEQTITVTRSTLENMPAHWVLTTPESAVRSYLDWVSYAYRTSKSDIASATMTPAQFVRVDAYNQMNLQKSQLIDQKIDSLELSKPVINGSRASVPAREKWTYSYVSATELNKLVGGPYEASYETTYTLLKTKDGWQVDSVKVTPLGAVK